jgi:hypothetical protein
LYAYQYSKIEFGLQITVKKKSVAITRNNLLRLC